MNRAEELPDGIVLGRFQPPHLGHVEYWEAAKSRCARLFIGVTNPDPASEPTIIEADKARSLLASNPFTYIDRHLMIEATLKEAGWSSDDYCIVAAPINQPQRLAGYLPSSSRATCFVTIYDAWGEQKKELLEAMGYRTEVLWRRTHAERLTSGTEIRDDLRSGDNRWRRVVPSAVVDYLVEQQLMESLYRKEQS